jgi:adenylyltransferase/sulfurtransferase
VNSLHRYHRQTLLPQVGEAGQARIGSGHAVIVGLGALGCAAADLLARAGVGMLTLIDRDVVEITNLQRQTLFGEADARERAPKAVAAARRLTDVNSSITVEARVADLSARNWRSLIPAAQPGSGEQECRTDGRLPATPGRSCRPLLLDGSDNFETRYLLNDISVSLGLPYLYAGVIACRGMAATFVPGGPCLRCVFPDAPAPGSQPTCDTAGVLGPAVAAVAAIQVTDALRLLATGEGVGSVLTDFDLWSGGQRRISLGRNTECPCCAERCFEHLATERDDAAALCGADTVQVWPRAFAALDLAALADRLRPLGEVTLTRFMLRASMRDGGSPIELSVFPDGRALIRGTTRPEVARTLYARYIGS